jgi:hypothetical protein
MRGDEMARFDEHGQAEGEPAGIGPEGAAAEPARIPWARPVVRRFALRETLAGSGLFSDGGGHSQVTPT